MSYSGGLQSVSSNSKVAFEDGLVARLVRKVKLCKGEGELKEIPSVWGVVALLRMVREGLTLARTFFLFTKADEDLTGGLLFCTKLEAFDPALWD